ncbi:MAG: hypothetical protein ABH840_04715 [Nanoarchaeota archaeon]
MRKLLGLALAFVVGCSSYNTDYKIENLHKNYQSTEQTRLSKKSLEETLFEDAKDGKLDMGFERALFIASGCEDFMADYYTKEVDVFLKEVIDSVKIRNDKLERARLIAKTIKEKTKYKLFEYRFHYLANREIRQGNCLGLTILFNLACEKDGIKSGFMNTLTHAFPYVEVDGKKTYFDLTIDTLAPDKKDLEDEFIYEPSKLDVVAQIYCIKGASLSKEGKIGEANAVYKKGLKINPKSLHILENLVRMNEWLNDGEAARNMDLYIAAYPELPHLYGYKARILLRLKRYEDAVSCLKKSLEIKRDSGVENWIREIREKHLEK